MDMKEYTTMDFMSTENNLSLVKRSMHNTNITTKQIAQYIMQSESLVNDWINGKTILAHKYVLQICDFLNIDPFELMRDNFTKNLHRRSRR
jgi:transcriptional regulator with XRE-family HTH domain